MRGYKHSPLPQELPRNPQASPPPNLACKLLRAIRVAPIDDAHNESLYPSAEEARTNCGIVEATARVRDPNFKYQARGKGATVIARFGRDGIAIADPNHAEEGVDKVFEPIYAEEL